MSNGSKIVKGMQLVRVLFGVLIVGFMLTGCMMEPQTVKLPASSWGDNYFYSYEPPEKRDLGSVKITMAVVNPYFSDKAAIDPAFAKVAKGFVKSMAIDMDKIIIAKGFTVTGPFESLDMMTYPDKKNANLTLTPMIILNAQIRDISGWGNRTDGGLTKSVEVRVDGWVVLEMREPMSSEKIWIKKIEVAEMTESVEMIAQKVPVYAKDHPLFPVGYNPGRLLYDGRPDAMAGMMKKMYPIIMQTAWKYIDTDEILALKIKADEIRALKRY